MSWIITTIAEQIESFFQETSRGKTNIMTLIGLFRELHLRLSDKVH